MITAIYRIRTITSITHAAVQVVSGNGRSMYYDVIQNGALLLRSLHYVMCYALLVVSHAYGFTVHGLTYWVIPLVLGSRTVCHVVKCGLRGLSSRCDGPPVQPRE